MYTNTEIAKAFQLWRLSGFTKLPILEKVRQINEQDLSDLALVAKFYEYLNKKGG